jgi:hypothetical protein
MYLIALVVIIVAFVLLGGGPWARGLMHGGHSLNFASWNWATILISMGVGIVIGILINRRR